MDYSTDTDLQLRTALRSLRKRQGLNQTQTGRLLGVSQMRIAHIEAAPMRTSFEQISRLIAALGARLVIDPLEGRLEENVSIYCATPSQTRQPSTASTLSTTSTATPSTPSSPPLPTKPKRKTKADKLRAQLENANW